MQGGKGSSHLDEEEVARGRRGCCAPGCQGRDSASLPCVRASRRGQRTPFVRNGETTASLVVIVKEELDHDQLLIFSSTCQVTGEGGQSWRCHIEDSILGVPLAAQQSTYMMDEWWGW